MGTIVNQHVGTSRPGSAKVSGNQGPDNQYGPGRFSAKADTKNASAILRSSRPTHLFVRCDEIAPIECRPTEQISRAGIPFPIAYIFLLLRHYTSPAGNRAAH